MRLPPLPLRLRLVSGFAVAMLVLLTGAGGFVYWRVRIALDQRLDEDLGRQALDLKRAALAHPGNPMAAISSVPAEDRFDQLLGVDGVLLAAAGQSRTRSLLPAQRLAGAVRGVIRFDLGNVLVPRGQHVRIAAAPVSGLTPPVIAVVGVRLDQRDEALRELLAQLAVANLLALLIASFVGYRLARAALAPVERYRLQAEKITAGASGVRLDVTHGHDDEVSRLGRTLNAMLAAQEKAAESQRRFIADASHELRTPLTLLTSEVELALRRRRPPEELESTLQAVADDTAQLVALADKLLDLETAEHGHGRRTTVDIKSVLAAARGRACRVLEPGSPRLVEAHEPATTTMCANEVSLLRILNNLAENAARHGEGVIRLSATDVPGGVRFAVHDHGQIAPAFLPHAADRFGRADTARTTRGSGLGLALVDALARAHDGQFRICSNGKHHAQPTPNQALARLPCDHDADGTTATVLLPTGRGRTPTGEQPASEGSS
ncbi:MAG: ATP-binding protein [Mycobacteriales bacterium]